MCSAPATAAACCRCSASPCAQQVTLQYRMDGTVATEDDPPVVLGQLPAGFIEQMQSHLRPGRLLRFSIGDVRRGRGPGGRRQLRCLFAQPRLFPRLVSSPPSLPHPLECAGRRLAWGPHPRPQNPQPLRTASCSTRAGPAGRTSSTSARATSGEAGRTNSARWVFPRRGRSLCRASEETAHFAESLQRDRGGSPGGRASFLPTPFRLHRAGPLA